MLSTVVLEYNGLENKVGDRIVDITRLILDRLVYSEVL